eukprot:2965638-Pyramimonas_sp.AAC.1
MEEGDVADIDPSEWMVPPQCIPIHANVTSYDWKPLYESTQFDAIMMDPPWQLATANPTRGVSLGYSQLTDLDITNLPIPKLQTDGLLFVWVSLRASSSQVLSYQQGPINKAHWKILGFYSFGATDGNPDEQPGRAWGRFLCSLNAVFAWCGACR